MAHPLDHALVITQIRSQRNIPHQRDARGSIKSSLNSGGFAPFMISLDPRFCPQKIVLIYEEEEAQFAYNVEAMLQDRDIAIERWPVNLNLVDETLHKLGQLLHNYKKPLPLCVNGDHPLLSTLCSAVFQQQKYPILTCVDGALYRLGARSQKINLEPQVDLEGFIALLGARTQPGWAGVWFEEHLKKLSHFLIGTAHNCSLSLEIIQRLAKAAKNKKLLSPPVKGTEIAIPLFQDVLDRFESAGCVELNQGRLLFSSEQHRAYCAGGWLSLYAQAALQSLSDSYHLWAARQDITIELAYPTPLERVIPLIALMNSHLMFFFCVSSNFAGINELMDDMEVLTTRFGAMILMLSTDELPEEVIIRARRQGVYVAQGDQLKDIDIWFTNEVLF
jgi:hypothetical protein